MFTRDERLRLFFISIFIFQYLKKVLISIVNFLSILFVFSLNERSIKSFSKILFIIVVVKELGFKKFVPKKSCAQ